MVTISSIQKDQLLHHILIGFGGDADLAKYHIAPGDTQSMAENSFSRIEEYEEYGTLEYYAVKMNEDVIGFTVFMKKEGKMPILVSFAINVLYRVGFILKAWLGLLIDKCHFFVGLNDKNTRAIKFFLNNKFSVHAEEQNMVLLCQR